LFRVGQVYVGIAGPKQRRDRRLGLGWHICRNGRQRSRGTATPATWQPFHARGLQQLQTLPHLLPRIANLFGFRHPAILRLVCVLFHPKWHSADVGVGTLRRTSPEGENHEQSKLKWNATESLRIVLAGLQKHVDLACLSVSSVYRMLKEANRACMSVQMASANYFFLSFLDEYCGHVSKEFNIVLLENG
jgi:hypothetical protein